MAHSDINLGSKLLKARREKHIHLTQASKDLCIPERYLKAFEKNDLKSLPEPIYAVGFMRTYADYLDLNPGPFVETLKSRFNSPPQSALASPGSPSSGTTVLGILLFLTIAGSLGFFGLKTMAGPDYKVENANKIPAHIATLLEDEEKETSETP